MSVFWSGLYVNPTTRISCYIMHLFIILHYSKTREDPGVRSWQNLTVGKSQPLQNLCLLQVWLATELTVGHCQQKHITGPVFNYDSNFFCNIQVCQLMKILYWLNFIWLLKIFSVKTTWNKTISLHSSYSTSQKLVNLRLHFSETDKDTA